MTLGVGTQTVSSNGQDTFYFRGHPRYDAVRIDFNSGNSSGTDVDVDIRVRDDDDPRDANSNTDYGNMTEVDSWDAIDPSSGDPTRGTTAMARTMAVRVDETSSGGSVEFDIVRHRSDDPAQNAQSFANR